MAVSKSRMAREIAKAEARDRKRRAEKRMKVSGKSVFTLARLSQSSPKKPRKQR
jgi:capsular polysaccharide biosynthesis protein